MTVNKANKLLGLVYRAEGSSNSGTFSKLYKSLVRPILEYAAAVWNPYLVKDVLALERVQRRASRFALGQKRGEIEYEERLRKLKWPTLETRWLFLCFAECYEIVFDGLNKPNTLIIHLNLLCVTQPGPTTLIGSTLSKQSLISINIPFLSESYWTGVAYQDLALIIFTWIYFCSVSDFNSTSILN